MELRKKLEDYALWMAIHYFVSDYPEGKNSEEILELIAGGDTDVSIWEPFESWNENSIINAIEELAYSLKHQYGTVLRRFGEEYMNDPLQLKSL